MCDNNYQNEEISMNLGPYKNIQPAVEQENNSYDFYLNNNLNQNHEIVEEFRRHHRRHHRRPYYRRFYRGPGFIPYPSYVQYVPLHNFNYPYPVNYTDSDRECKKSQDCDIGEICYLVNDGNPDKKGSCKIYNM